MLVIRKEMNNHHELPEALVLTCVDFRFQEKLKEALQKLKIKKYDLLALAGGAKNLASPTKAIYQKTVLDNIKLAVGLHKIKTMVLMNHIDCGAYGGSGEHKNLRAEITFHKSELKKAEELIKKIFPDLKIKFQLLTL